MNRAKQIEDILRKIVDEQDGWHEERCIGEFQDDRESLPGDCTCGATQLRDDARAALALPPDVSRAIPSPQKLIDMMLHATGDMKVKRGSGLEIPWRNYYVAGGDDAEGWRFLVLVGLATGGRSSDLTGGDPAFSVSLPGLAFLKAKLKADRASLKAGGT